MQKKLHIGLVLFLFISVSTKSQNIFSGEPVQVVGSFNGYVTTPYNSDYRTSAYRRVSTPSGTPVDGRGQWATTINVQSSGGDVVPVNMLGGGGNGFLFISGPSADRFQNKWVFSGVGQGTVDALNNITAFNSGNDMGLNMNTAGYYTFVLNDAGYTQTNAIYYVGYTSTTPVTVTQGLTTVLPNGVLRVRITTSATPSAQQNIYVRYRNGTNDFSASTSLVQATGSGTSWSADIPSQTIGSTTFYYIFTSTRSLAQLTANTEQERSIAHLRYTDNGGTNFSYVASTLPVAFTDFSAVKENGIVKLNWRAEETDQFSHYEVEHSTNGSSFAKKQQVEKSNSGINSAYTAYDLKPVSGVQFYRIAAVSVTGSKKYSSVLRITIGGRSKSFLVFPQQGGNQFAVQLNELPIGNYHLSVIASNGQLIYSRIIAHEGSDQTLIISMDKPIASGIYRIILRGESVLFNQSILMQ